MSKYTLTINTDSVEDISAAVAALTGETIPEQPGIMSIDASGPVTVENVPEHTVVTSVPSPEPVSDVDARGMPWDARIHASTKTQKKDGTWKAKKGVDQALVAQVEAEHMGGSVANPEQPALQASGMVAPGVTPEMVNNTPPAPVNAPVENPAPAPATGMFAPQADGAPSFAELFQQITNRVANPADQLSEGTVKAICINHGITNAADLATRPDLIASFAQQVAAVQ